MTDCESYARWVLSPENATETGRLIKLACERFLSDLERSDIYFDEERARQMTDFAEKHCVQWEGDWRGKPVTFEPWQKFHLHQTFGWIRKDTGTRRFNRVFIQVAKKNGKSTESAVLANYHLFADPLVGTPKVFTAANNEDQAKISVNMAGRIIEQSPDLYDYVEDGEVKLMTYGMNITEVIHKEKDGFIKALSKETEDRKSKTAGGKHGINASLGIVDEFGMSPDYGASAAIETSMASRKEWLMFYITTAGYNKDGPCYTELRELGIKVLEGLIKMDNYLPIIYELDSGDDYKDERVWRKCNPNLGISVNKEFLRAMVEKAILKGGSVEVDVKTLNFNMWVDSAEVFIQSEVWNENSQGLQVEEGAECYGGLEVATGTGMSAFCLYFPGEVNKLKVLFWMPSEGAKADGGFDHYAVWAKDGFIKLDPGNVVDNEIAVKWIIEFISQYNMHSFAFPKPLENNSIVQELIKSGYVGNGLSQGLAGISTPTSEWEKLFLARKMNHFGNPVLAWANSNCMAIKKEQGIRIEKNQKVLPVYACINALAQCMTIKAGEIIVDTQFTSL